MLSAGLIGGPGLGYCKDRFAGESLKATAPAVYEAYKSDTSSRFLNLPATEVFGLNGKMVAEARSAGESASEDQKTAIGADQKGDRLTLQADSYIPATMAAIYLGLLLYFQSVGGYKRVHMAS